MSDTNKPADNALDAFLNGPEETPTQAISDADFDALDGFLLANTQMDIEILDGFLCALIISPSVVPPGEYLPVIFGNNEITFKTQEEADQIMNAITKHWEYVESKLKNKEDYYPIVCSDNQLKVNAWGWAYGFLLGTSLRREDWHPTIYASQMSEDGLVSPILQLHWEANGQMEPINADKREVMMKTIVANLPIMYEQFAELRELSRSSLQQPN